MKIEELEAAAMNGNPNQEVEVEMSRCRRWFTPLLFWALLSSNTNAQQKISGSIYFVDGRVQTFHAIVRFGTSGTGEGQFGERSIGVKYQNTTRSVPYASIREFRAIDDDFRVNINTLRPTTQGSVGLVDAHVEIDTATGITISDRMRLRQIS